MLSLMKMPIIFGNQSGLASHGTNRDGIASLAFRRNGQLTLPFVLLIGGIIVEVAIAGAFVTYFLSSSGYGERLSIRAAAAAESGIRDAMVRITQNKEFLPNTGITSYSITHDNNDTAIIIINRADSGNIYKYTVESLGTAVSRQKKFSAIIAVDGTTGQIELQSIQEIAVE